jgi:succinate dehydrogenase / fumarate reductase cytochrome b subunit
MSQTPTSARPLSPHLSIYKFTWLMVGSIMHRITGAALYLSTLILLWGLIALYQGPEAYQLFLDYAHSLAGKLVLFGATWALMHHALGGLRHLIWDTGLAFEVPLAKKLAIANFIGAVALTLLVWFLAGAFA